MSLLGRADAADRGTAVRALALGDVLAVLGLADDRVLHFLLSLALHAISLDCHDSFLSTKRATLCAALPFI